MTSGCNVKRVFCKTLTGLCAGTLTNGADLDQTPHNTVSDQGLHCMLKVHEVTG